MRGARLLELAVALCLVAGCKRLLGGGEAERPAARSLDKARVESMGVDLRREEKTICPWQEVQVAVFARVVFEGEERPVELETPGGKEEAPERLVAYDEFAFHSEQGTFGEGGVFTPNPDLLVTASEPFKIKTVYKRRPDKFTFETSYPPDYACVESVGFAGVAGPSGQSGDFGQSGRDASSNSDKPGEDGGDGGNGGAGGSGGDGGRGPDVEAFATFVSTKFYDKLVAVIAVSGGATSRLFAEHHRLRRSIDAGVEEQFKITRQLGMMRDNARDLPFQLPYKVSRDDYGKVLLLLMERLEADKARIAAVESAITSVGLQVRSTDAGSGSLSRNVAPVLVAVASDAEAAISPPVDFPGDEGLRRGLAAKGMALRAAVEETAEYRQWLRLQEQAEEVVVGGLIALLERATGLPISAAYREIQAIWRGEGDYLQHLRRLVRLVPGGSKLAAVVDVGVELTERLRDVRDDIRGAVARSDEAIKTVRSKGVSLLVNAGSRYARERVGKQLAFFETADQLERVSEELDAIPWLRG